MILTGQQIAKEYDLGRIDIRPFNQTHLSPNSYDFRLGPVIKRYKNYILDCKKDNPTIELPFPVSGLVLEPGWIYLGHTMEIMGSDYYVPIIRGRSSTARLGLFIHVTADIIDIGSHNQWTLQLHAVQPVRIYPDMLIGQVTFWRPEGSIELYSGKYQGSMGPWGSQIHRDFYIDDNKKEA
ncbi:MAG: dCTP deaminase [Nitrospirae bacterium]|nr:dCTP deaminase [Nitrospirota bacterium]